MLFGIQSNQERGRDKDREIAMLSKIINDDTDIIAERNEMITKLEARNAELLSIVFEYDEIVENQKRYIERERLAARKAPFLTRFNNWLDKV